MACGGREGGWKRIMLFLMRKRAEESRDLIGFVWNWADLGGVCGAGWGVDWAVGMERGWRVWRVGGGCCRWRDWRIGGERARQNRRRARERGLGNALVVFLIRKRVEYGVGRGGEWSVRSLWSVWSVWSGIEQGGIAYPIPGLSPNPCTGCCVRVDGV